MASQPVLSVVLAADSAAQARHTARAFAEQSGADCVELVLVGPEEPPIDPAGLGVDGRLWGITVVSRPAHRELQRSRAAGVRAAQAPFVALAETHAFPQRGWLDAVLAAFERDKATVVGPAMLNATPRSAIGWSNFLLDYGPWAEPVDPSNGDTVPGHNSVFRRDALLELGDELDDLFEADWVLLQRLMEAGAVVRLVPEARVAHVSVEKRRAWLRERHVAGRVFATARARDWTRSRRLFYAVAAPIIPLVRARQVRADHRRTRSQQPAPRRVALVSAAGLVASAFGEHLGYAYGASDRAMAELYEIELNRIHYVRPGRA